MKIFWQFSAIFVLLLDFAKVWSSDCDEYIDPLLETKQNLTVCNSEFTRMEHEQKAILNFLEIEYGKCFLYYENVQLYLSLHYHSSMLQHDGME